jgi:hypothetical protein
MTVEALTAILLIVVPVAFNLAFFELGRAFDYPDILRREPDEILRRFDAGGAGLLLRWEAPLLSARHAALAGSRRRPRRVAGHRSCLSSRCGPALVRRSACSLAVRRRACPPTRRGAGGPTAMRRASITVARRSIGCRRGIGEHLGYLLTGL